MRRSALVLTMALLAGWVLPGMGQATTGVKAAAKAGDEMRANPIATAGLKCTGTDGRTPCNAQQIADLNQGLATGRRMHKPLMTVRNLTSGPNGTLVCKQTNGRSCTEEQLDAIIAVAASTHSAGTAFHVMKSTDKASPNL
jgi:hypothetical protein